MNLKDYIIVIKNAVPSSLCDKILKEYIESDEWIKAQVSKDGVSDTSSRNCNLISISQGNVISKNYDTRLNIDQELYQVATKCIKKYIAKFPFCNVEADTGYDLLQYKQGGFYVEHVDSFIQQFRTISCSLILNDDFEGGEFAFFNGEMTYKLNKGDALLFPSNFMFPHEVKEVKSGTRYSVITWFK